MIRPGRMKHKVAFERLSETTNDFGEKTKTWAPLFLRFVSIEPLNGREYFESSGQQSAVSTRIRARFDSESKQITPEDRICYGSHVFNIEAVINPRLEDRELIFMCSEKSR